MAIVGTVEIDLVAKVARLQYDLNKATRSIDRFSSDAKKSFAGIKSATDALNLVFGKLGFSVIGAGTAFAGLKSAISSVVDTGIEAERAQSRLEGVIKATGGAAGVGADEIDRMSKSLQNSTLFDDEAVKNAAGTLLLFKSIQGDVFRDALKLTTDLGAALGGDLNDKAMLLGKALSDPKEGLSALARTFKDFNPEVEKAAIRLADMGDKAGAQQIIMTELKGRVDGVAESMNSGLTGSITQAKNAWDDFKESLAATAVIENGISGVLKPVISLFQKLTDVMEENNKARERSVNLMGGKLSPLDGGNGIGELPSLPGPKITLNLEGSEVTPEAAREELKKLWPLLFSDADLAAKQFANKNKRIKHGEDPSSSGEEMVGPLPDLLSQRNALMLEGMAAEEAALQESTNRKHMIESAYYDERLAKFEQHEKDKADLELQHSMFKLQQTGGILGSLSALVDGKSKKQFEASKALARAETIVSTYAAAQLAYHSQLTVPSPDAPARAALAAGAAVFAGLARLKAINSTSYGGGGGGNPGGGGGSTGGGSGSVPNGVPTGPIQQQKAPQQVLQIQFYGNTYGMEDFEDRVVAAVTKASDKDIVFINNNTAQTREIMRS